MSTLTDLARVRRYLKLDPSNTEFDDLLTDLLNGVSEEFRQFVGHDFDKATYTDTYLGSGNGWLWLAQGPIIQVRSLAERGQPVPPTDGVAPGYFIADGGVSWMGGQFTRGRLVQIVYDAGYETVPEDIQQACVHVVALRYRLTEHLGITSKASGNGSTTTFDTIDLPQPVKDTLQKYISVAPVRAATSTRTVL